MGRSAKFHKKVKKTKASSTSATTSHSKPPTHSTQDQKKKANLKSKTKSANATKGGDGHVLGGADYVGMLLGGRRKAKEEATKMPVDED